VRFSVGIENTPEEIDRAADVIAAIVNRLRASQSER
jgi:cysteine sulfinate desulfinase/cysteine desulfurase-like protein